MANVIVAVQHSTQRRGRRFLSAGSCFLLSLFFLAAVAVPADAAITKSVSFQAGAPYPGSTVIYTIDYSFTLGSRETVAIGNATLDDTVPTASLSLVTRTLDSTFNGSTWATPALQWSNGSTLNLASYSGSVTYTATINGNVAPGTVVTNPVCLNLNTFVTPALVAPRAITQECAQNQFTVVALPSTPVPTMTTWVMIIFVLAAGLGQAYYLRRRAAS